MRQPLGGSGNRYAYCGRIVPAVSSVGTAKDKFLKLTFIPEPVTFSLLGLGLIGFALKKACACLNRIRGESQVACDTFP